MQAFTYHSPTEIVFGLGAEDRLAEMVRKYGGTRVMLVYGGGSVRRSGLLDRITGGLEASGLAVTAFGGALPNPLLAHAREGVRLALDFDADFIVGVGGGSAIDTAKAIAHGKKNPDTDLWAYWSRQKTLAQSLPVGVVLTISAAGSETSNSAVLTNGETGQKRGLATELNRPAFALMNPALTYSLPPYQIACGVVDIMMHTLDRYFAGDGNEFTSEIAEALLRVVIKNGTEALKNPADYQAASELMWCGSVSHNGLTGLGGVMDFSVHQLGHELSAKFDLAHGASLSIMWGAWADYVCEAAPGRFARYAEKVWNEAWNKEGLGLDSGGADFIGKKGRERTAAYFKSLGMPTCFSESEIGVQPDEVIRDLAWRCSYQETRLVGQFRPLNRDDLYQIYTAVNR